MIGDLNEMAARPRVQPLVALEVPISIPQPDGSYRPLMLHEITDEDIAQLVQISGPNEGWRWVRAVSRLLAGLPPRKWDARGVS